MSKKKTPLRGDYRDILAALGEWKALSVGELKKLCLGEVTSPNLRKKIRKLEELGLLKSISLDRKSKYIFLTSLGVKLSPFRPSEKISENELTHELITAQVLREFLKLPECLDGKIRHHMDSIELCPDAEIILSVGGKKIKVALEIELHRKDKRRVVRKFNRYKREGIFDRVLFITQSEGIFRGYAHYLGDLGEKVQKNVAVVLDSKLSISEFDFRESHCFYRKKVTNFFSIFEQFGELHEVTHPLRPYQIPP